MMLFQKKSYEHLVYRLRRHPITFVPVVFLSLVLICAPIALYIVNKSTFPELFESERNMALAILGSSAYLLSMYLFFYVRFIDYYLDIWIVTNDRIVDIEQHGLFTRTITELDLHNIQDVTVKVHGLFATLFHYGDVIIKTASSTNDIIFYSVSNPNRIRERLIQLADDDRQYHA